MRVLVIGAGPAGSTAAIALARRGIEAVVVEVQDQVRPVGVGLMLQNSPLRALDTLGLVEACMERGYIHQQIDMCDATGEVRMVIDPPTLIPGKPAMVAISRAALAEVLLSAVEDSGATLRYGVTVEELEDRGDSVRVRLTDGSVEAFDLVLAADGLHSASRRRLLPDAPEPARTGQLIWRASAPRLPQVDRYKMYDAGPELGKVGLVPIGPAEIYLWMLQTDTGQERPAREDLLASLRAALLPFGDQVPEVAAVLRPDVDVRSLQALLVPAPWHRGRVLCIGDAVHTTTPHIAYGVGMAIEDSVIIAELLAVAQAAGPDAVGPRELDAVLAGFTARRWERCKLVVESSVQLGEWEQHPPADRSAFGELTGRALGALAQAY